MAHKENAAGGGVQRKHPRYAVPWRIVVVFKRQGRHETHRGSIADLSLGGASFLSELNIASPDPVVATIEIPVYTKDQKKTIVGVRCLIMHSVLSSNYGKYRIGMKFIDFNGKGERELTAALSKMVAIGENKSYYS